MFTLSAAASIAAFSQTYGTNQTSPTFILSRSAGTPMLGFIIASGQHKGEFNPCNTSDFIDLSGQHIAKSGAPCPQLLDPGQIGRQERIVPGRLSSAPLLLDPRWFANGKTLNGDEIVRILKSNALAPRFLKITQQTKGAPSAIPSAFPAIYKKTNT
jgi:hypothetical protein